MSEEIAEPDGDPIRVGLLGESLVAFRDTEGRVGVLGEFCPHRRVSLLFGRNEECGLRCLYHGWKFDVNGRVIDLPSEPSDRSRAIFHTSYPTREAGGLVWVYMGDPKTMPEFEMPPWCSKDGTKVSIAKIEIPCNWAQITEGALDSAHSSNLHSSEIRPASVSRGTREGRRMARPSEDKAPRMQVQPTTYGFRYAAIRTPIENADTTDYVRVTVYVAPFTVLIPPNADFGVCQLSIPVNDTTTSFYFLAFGEGDVIEQNEWRAMMGARMGIDIDKNYRALRTLENNFLQDRKAMKAGDFSGIYGVPNQDIAMWVTQGGIAERGVEKLGASDIAIVQFRTRLLNGIKAEADPGLSDQRFVLRNLSSVRAFEGVVEKTVDWRSLNVGESERETFTARRSIARASTAAE